MRNRIIVEAQVLAEPNKAGVEEYAEKLLQAYLLLRPNSNMTLALFGKANKDIAVEGENVQRYTVPFHVRLARKLNSYRLMPPLEWLFGKGIYVFPHFVWWRTGSSPSISFIHDTVFFSAPETMDEANLRYMLKTIRRTADKTDIVLTISESSKRDIMQHLGVDKSKIHVVYPGVELDEYKPATAKETDKVKKKYGLADSYVLFQSTLEPRKNIKNLLRAFSQLPDELKKSHQLVLAGKPGWHYDETRAEIQKAMDTGVDVLLPGYIDAEDNPALFSGATALASPSIYEGFGMPLLKAMACGTPVVTSKTSSMPEVIGECGLLVDPTEVSDISQALATVLTDKQKVAKMVACGKKRVKQFTWQSSAKSFADVIDSLK